jgi:cell division protease FtsH
MRRCRGVAVFCHISTGSLARTVRRIPRFPRFHRSALVYLLVGLAVLFIGAQLLRPGPDHEDLDLSTFRQKIDEGEVVTATIKDRDHVVEGELRDETEFRVSYPAEFADELVEELGSARPPIEVETDQQDDSMWTSVLFSLLPTVLLVGAFLLVMNAFQGGGGRVMQFGKSKAKPVSKDAPTVTFSDVAGCDEAVEELQEVKEFLQDPARFQAMGARIPKGVLLYGPPGTGKTLLARAVAGEAGVPFFPISGSDFVEMFVGVGASRVRDLFEKAKEAAPAIVFVDEIDAVGRHRGAGLGGGHDEREQTLNQLLVEMDGFDAQTGVILIAATNRPDILDPALLRPGRFDRQIVVDQPDLEGRRAILDVHAKGKPLAGDVRLDVLARRTPGFTGADLANLMNEAALLTARRNRGDITMLALEESIDRVMAGPERKTRVMSDREKRVIAYHEGGHTLVGHVLAGTDPIHKVSIVARGRALGWTLALPTEDKYLKTRSELIDAMTMLLGGRTAEEIVFCEPTTGASDDIERCTEIARKMVVTYGMSDRLGPQQLGSQQQEVFLGKDYGHEATYSDEVAGQIDREVRRLVDEAHDRARVILTTHRATLDRLARALVEKETLDDKDLAEVFGPIDKGAGVEMPPTRTGMDGAADLRDRLGTRELAGAALASTGAAADAVPPGRPEAAPAGRPAPSLRQLVRQRLGRWLGAESPSPSGT